jgi:dinuclear metal center YbgI/SA1388 family protein
MIATVSDIIDVMNTLAPHLLAEEWDNVGLQIGDPQQKVKNIWIALDPTLPVLDAACRENVDLLITHHPLIFRPLKSIDFQTPLGSLLNMAVRHRLAVFSAHTNLDIVAGGINDILSERIGLTNLKILRKTSAPCKIQPSDTNGSAQGLGRIGTLESSLELITFAKVIKKKMGIKTIRFAGNPSLAVKEVAVCSGSGSGLLPDFFSSAAQVYVSGDLKYHDARDVEAAKLGIIDIGHFSSEKLIIHALSERLKEILPAKGFEVNVVACDLEKDPFLVL